MKRSEFIRSASGVAAWTLMSRVSAATPTSALKAAVIGHNGRGNFGHNLDLVFNDRPGIEVVAVADPDPVGRAKARERARARTGYASYREMLTKERPHLVSVAPRWTDQHHAMVSAALAVGAHVYCEKPFTRTLAEADDFWRTRSAPAARSPWRIRAGTRLRRCCSNADSTVSGNFSTA